MNVIVIIVKDKPKRQVCLEVTCLIELQPRFPSHKIFLYCVLRQLNALVINIQTLTIMLTFVPTYF